MDPRLRGKGTPEGQSPSVALVRRKILIAS